MFKKINLKCCNGEEKAFDFLANGATAYKYRQVFHEDLMLKLSKLQDFQNKAEGGDTLIIDKLAFVMNAQARKINTETINTKEFEDWLEMLESGELLAHADEIISLYIGNKISMSTAKKN